MMMRRWYMIVGVILLVPAMLVPLTVLSVEVIMYARGMIEPRPWWIDAALLDVGIACWAMVVPWFFWLCPWLAANDPHVTFVRPPREHAKLLQVIVLMPGGLCLLLAVGLAWWDRDPLWMSLALFMLLVSWTWWLSRRVKRRFRATMAQRLICWQCGYDLRGNPTATACPECGEAIRWSRC